MTRIELTDDIEIFHDGYWFQGKYNDTGFSVSLNSQCTKEDAEQLVKELIQNQKLRELMEDYADFYDGKITQYLGKLFRQILKESEND